MCFLLSGFGRKKADGLADLLLQDGKPILIFLYKIKRSIAPEVFVRIDLGPGREYNDINGRVVLADCPERIQTCHGTIEVVIQDYQVGRADWQSFYRGFTGCKVHGLRPRPVEHPVNELLVEEGIFHDVKNELLIFHAQESAESCRTYHLP